MPNLFYLGQPDFIEKLNQLADRIGTQGPQGDPGPAPVTLSGSGDPNAQSPDFGDLGNYYIDETNSLYYQKQLVGSPEVAMWVQVATIPGTGGEPVLAKYDVYRNETAAGAVPGTDNPILGVNANAGSVAIDLNSYRDIVILLDDQLNTITISDFPAEDFPSDTFTPHSPTGIPVTLRFVMGNGSPNSGKIAATAFDSIAGFDFRHLDREVLKRFDFDLNVGQGDTLVLSLLYSHNGRFGWSQSYVDSSDSWSTSTGNYVWKVVSLRMDAAYVQSGSIPRQPVVFAGNQVIAGAEANLATKVFSSSFSNAPTTGGTVAIPNNTNFVALEPAGTLATLTITLPTAMLDGQEITIVSTQIITALTLTDPGGNTITNPPTSMAAGVPIKYRFVLLASNGADLSPTPTYTFKWYRC